MAETRIIVSSGDAICRICRNSRAGELQKSKRDKEGRTRFAKDSEIKKRYGLPHGTYDEEFAKQSGLCAICGKASPDRDLQIDHCHESGKFRSLLCISCNTGLGHLKEDPRILENMINYIAKHRGAF